MEYSIAEITEKVLAGYRFKRGDDLQVFLQAPLEELQHGAGVLQKHFCGNHIDFCTIINGRSGRCGEVSIVPSQLVIIPIVKNMDFCLKKKSLPMPEPIRMLVPTGLLL